jgi:hypothetical protein
LVPSSREITAPNLALALATVLGNVFLQAGDSHGHPVRQLAFLDKRQLPKPNQVSKPIARFEELAFEPSMFRTTYCQRRKQQHRAPVENADAQTTLRANKKQIVFSSYLRL